MSFCSNLTIDATYKSLYTGSVMGVDWSSFLAIYFG